GTRNFIRPPHFLELFRGQKTIISLPLSDELLREFLMTLDIFGLQNRFAIPLKTKPFETAQNRIDVFWLRSFVIRIFNPKQKPAGFIFRVEVVEQRRAGAADVQLACWRGSKSCDGQIRFAAVLFGGCRESMEIHYRDGGNQELNHLKPL